MEQVPKDYEELLRLFNAHKVKYCIVGAYALALYAAPRYTKDMDIFIETSSSNAKRVLAALRAFGFGKVALTEEDFVKPGKTIQLGYEPLRVDLLTSIDGCSFDQVWRNRRKKPFGKVKANFLSIHDLIRNKKASNRRQDQADLERLKTPRAR